MPVGGPNREERTALRRCMLAVSVLDDIDMLPTDDGMVLNGVPELTVSFAHIAAAIGTADPAEPIARRRLELWLRARRAIADKSSGRARGDHQAGGSPGRSRHCIRGRVGCGSRFSVAASTWASASSGLFGDAPDAVVVTPQTVLDAAGIDPGPWWRGATEYLENMGALATTRWRRDPRSPVRPMGDCDVITLLASSLFRGALCADAGGMRAIAAPVRTRGWLDLSRIDPAFAQTAAALADDESRGFPRPLLLTVDEVSMVSDGGRPAEIVLRDPATDEKRWLRDVLYH